MSSVPQSRRRLSFRSLAAIISVLGLIALGFVAGTAVMYFHLPPSGFMERAFAGSRSWWEGHNSAPEKPAGDLAQAGVTIDRPEATCDGFTLVATNQSTTAFLIDMCGRKVHRWKLPAVRPWPRQEKVREPQPGGWTHWEKCSLTPEGDLLALCCGDGIPFGYGLAKIDKESGIRWGYSANIHHDFDVGEDGRIYLLTDKGETETPSGSDSIPGPRFAEYVVVLSAEGEELQKVSILDAFRDSSYALTLPRFTPAHPTVPENLTGPESKAPLDLLHANSIRVLNPARGKHFPLFHSGQVLLSLRSPNALAMLDLQKRSIVWASRGVWQAQHDAELLDNGKLLFFDNLGGPHGARVLEYDPINQAIDWSWEGEESSPMNCDIRGGVQRLDNGNTLIVDSVGCKVLEVTRRKEVVWQWHCPAPPARQDSPALNITCAHRYRPDQIPFFKGVPRNGSK
jgi:hypothetical protein